MALARTLVVSILTTTMVVSMVPSPEHLILDASEAERGHLPQHLGHGLLTRVHAQQEASKKFGDVATAASAVVRLKKPLKKGHTMDMGDGSGRRQLLSNLLGHRGSVARETGCKQPSKWAMAFGRGCWFSVLVPIGAAALYYEQISGHKTSTQIMTDFGNVGML